MMEFEADDALASAAARFKNDPTADQIVICSPDKDLAQAVSGSRIVCWDRRRDIVLDEAGVVEKFSVHHQSIPDWLSLVGDSADGFPGVPGWGAKSASAVLSQYEHLESIPPDPQVWGLRLNRAARLAVSLTQHKEDAMLYRRLATLREDVPLQETLGDLEWKGSFERLKDICHQLGDESFIQRIPRWR
jgi:5'-3' exonuclease